MLELSGPLEKTTTTFPARVVCGIFQGHEQGVIHAESSPFTVSRTPRKTWETIRGEGGGAVKVAAIGIKRHLIGMIQRRTNSAMESWANTKPPATEHVIAGVKTI